MKAIPVERIEAKLRDIEAQIANLELLKLQRDVLRDLIGEAVSVNGKPSNGRLGPTDAVLRLLRAEPGMRRAILIERLRERVESSGDVRRILYSTISSLKNRKKIVEDESGHLRLA